MNSVPLAARDNSDLIEAAYAQWLDNPDSVDPTWRAFFQGFTLGNAGSAPGAKPTSAAVAAAGVRVVDSYKQAQIIRYINAHRSHGHLEAHLDPLGEKPAAHPKLTLEYFGLGAEDLNESFTLTNFQGGGQRKLRDIQIAVKRTYCGNIGVEYMHVQDHDAREWLQKRMENVENVPSFTKNQKTRILRRLHKAELFEKFLHTKFVGQKRFSLEGGETMIAALDTTIEHCADIGVEEIVMGMAHRGRLSVLTNILRKPFDVLFEQFSENYIPHTVAGDGDVKYHLGYESVLATTSGKTVLVRLAANPSHLLLFNPVLVGLARAGLR
ncbi:MAG: 2-oxoglutarate dehydrogenase E1 component, partial [Burkholderiales bacterium]|nr:2-oxoglutarate dehydrogenase E1 component [Opitutaceae bacterium]